MTMMMVFYWFLWVRRLLLRLWRWCPSLDKKISINICAFFGNETQTENHDENDVENLTQVPAIQRTVVSCLTEDTLVRCCSSSQHPFIAIIMFETDDEADDEDDKDYNYNENDGMVATSASLSRAISLLTLFVS